MTEKQCGSCKFYILNDGKYTCQNELSDKYLSSTAPTQNCNSYKKKPAHTQQELKYYQSLPLEMKIEMTRNRIREWVDTYGESGVYVSFSGGKDSTVLLDIVRKDFPNIKAVFVDTGLEYPSIRRFVRTKDNVTRLSPEMSFRDVVYEWGYPLISKEVSKAIYYCRKGSQWAIRAMKGLNSKDGTPSPYMTSLFKKYDFLINAPFLISDKCCRIIKEKPAYKIHSKMKPFSALLAEESYRRKRAWLNGGCNSFTTGMSKPMSFWTEQDVLTYIKNNDLPIADIYGSVVEKDKTNTHRGCKLQTTEYIVQVVPSVGLVSPWIKQDLETY